MSLMGTTAVSEARASRRRGWLMAGAVCVVGLYGASAFWDVASARRGLDDALRDGREVRRGLATLRRRGPAATAVAPVVDQSPADIARRIESALSEADLGPGALVRQTPGALRRIGRTDYRRRRTEITLAGVTLEQTVRFCDALGDDPTGGGRVTGLRLKVPEDDRGEDYRRVGNDRRRVGPERWDAELILTRVVYSPTSDADRRPVRSDLPEP